MIPGSDDPTAATRSTEHEARRLADADAIARTLAGDRDAFASLVRRYTAVAHAVAGAVVQSDADADDVVQDAFLIAFRKLASARDTNEFKAWFLRIVRNRAYNVMEFQRLRSHENLSGTERAAEAGDPASLAERSEEHAAIRRALVGLKPVLREVFLLYDAEGFAHAEIARLLGTSEVMSRKHLMYARRILRDRLQRFRGDR